jgi:hypothetical protein
MSRLGALYVISAIEEAAAGGRPGVSARRAADHPVLASGRPGGRSSRARGGCWLRRTAAPAALVAELGGAVSGSARRGSRTERPPGGHPRVIVCARWRPRLGAALPTMPRPQAAQPTV